MLVKSPIVLITSSPIKAAKETWGMSHKCYTWTRDHAVNEYDTGRYDSAYGFVGICDHRYKPTQSPATIEEISMAYELPRISEFPGENVYTLILRTNSAETSYYWRVYMLLGHLLLPELSTHIIYIIWQSHAILRGLAQTSIYSDTHIYHSPATSIARSIQKHMLEILNI